MDEIDGTTGAEGTGAIDVVLKLCGHDARNLGGGGGGWSKGGGGDGGGGRGRDEEDMDAMEEEEGGDAGDTAGGGDDVEMAEAATKKGKGAKGKKAPAKPKMLNRPIICICNDL